MQWFIGNLAFFFVLTNGWDCLAWQRFSWDPTVTGELWTPRKTTLLDFAKSNVAITLYAMAFPTIIPLLIGGYVSLRSDNKLAGLNDKQASNKALKGLVACLVGVALSLIVAGIATLASSYTANMCLITVLATAVAFAIILLVPGSLFYRLVAWGFISNNSAMKR